MKNSVIGLTVFLVVATISPLNAMFRLMKTRQIANICSTPKMLLSSGIAAGTTLASANSNLSDSQNMKDGQNQASQLTDVQQKLSLVIEVNSESIYTAKTQQETDRFKLMANHLNLYQQCMLNEVFGKELTDNTHQRLSQDCRDLLKKFVDISYSNPLEAAQQYDKAQFITHAIHTDSNQTQEALKAFLIHLSKQQFNIPDEIMTNITDSTKITAIESIPSDNSKQNEHVWRVKSQCKIRLPWLTSPALTATGIIQIPSAGESNMLARVHLELGKNGISQSTKITAEFTLDGGAKVS